MDPEQPTQSTRTLLHAHHAESFRAGVFIFKVEPLAVIAHRQADSFGRAAQPDGDVGRLGMLGHVLQTLLQDAKQVGGHFRRDRLRHLTREKPHGEPGPFRELGDVISCGNLQANVFEQGRVQPLRQIVQVVGKRPDLNADRSELPHDQLW